MMQPGSEKKNINKTEYERLCREACEHPVSRNPDETTEDAYWRIIYQKVSQHLGVEFTLNPGGDAPPGDSYRRKLQQMVDDARAEYFDTLAIPTKYIKEALSETGG